MFCFRICKFRWWKLGEPFNHPAEHEPSNNAQFVSLLAFAWSVVSTLFNSKSDGRVNPLFIELQINSSNRENRSPLKFKQWSTNDAKIRNLSKLVFAIRSTTYFVKKFVHVGLKSPPPRKFVTQVKVTFLLPLSCDCATCVSVCSRVRERENERESVWRVRG